MAAHGLGHALGMSGHLGIVRLDHRALVAQQADHVHGRRLARVLGAALEGQAPHADALALERAAQAGPQLAHGLRALDGVDLLDGGEHRGGDAEGLADVAQGGHVLGQAAAAEADARLEEVGAHPRVVRDALHDAVDVDADGLAQARHLVDERDARGQEGIGHVLDHLRRAQVGHDDGPAEALVEARHGPRVGLVAGAHDDALGVEEVLDGVTLAQELGVGHDARAAVLLLQRALEDRLDRLAGADRRGALVDQDRRRAVEGRGDGVGGGPDVAQVGRAGHRLRRIDGQEDELGLGQRLGVARREAQVARRHALGHQLRQARLVELHVAALERLDEGVLRSTP